MAWRAVGWFGVVFAGIGLADSGLHWYPLAFGSPEWEFSAVSMSFGALPLVTLGDGEADPADGDGDGEEDGDPVVITSVGGVELDSRLANLLFAVRGVVIAKSYPPGPVTAPVRSTEAQVFTAMFGPAPTFAPTGGALS